MADIIYTYKDSVYANITNKCNLRCTFCIRFLKDGVGDADTLWHQKNPSLEDVTKPVVANAFENMIDFTKRCRQEIGDVKWTIVDVLPEEEKDRCIALSKENDIPLRIRKFSKNNP